MKKFPVAVAVTALVVAGCLAYSLFVSPVAAVKVKPGDWIADEANVLSESTEDALRSYNQSFDQNYGSVIAVATVSSTRGWTMEDYALKLGEDWELGSKDLVLLLDIGGEDAYLMESGDWTTLDPSAMLNQTMAADFFGGNYDSAVLSLFSTMSGWYPENGGNARSDPYAGYAQPNNYSSPSDGVFAMILRVIIILLVIYLILAAIERARYRRWYRDYGYMSAPTVYFTPVFPWHRPGSSWYNRMGHRPPPPGSGGPGGPRPGGPAPRPNSYRPAPGPRPGPARPSSGPRPGPARPSSGPRPGPARPSSGPRPGPARPSSGSRPGPARPSAPSRPASGGMGKAGPSGGGRIGGGSFGSNRPSRPSGGFGGSRPSGGFGGSRGGSFGGGRGGGFGGRR